MDPNKQNNKSWKQEGIYNTYEEADSYRAVLLSMNTDNKLLVKIKRCGSGGSKFKVKSYYPPQTKTKKGKDTNE